MKIIKTEAKDNYAVFETEFSSDEVKQAEKECLIKFAKNIKIKGYRTGKVPLEIAKKQISKDELEYRVVNLLAEKNYSDLEKSDEYKNFDAETTGEWTVSLDEYNENSVTKISYKFELYPEVKVGDYKKLELPNFDFKITDETIEKELNFLLKASAKDVEFKDDEKINEGDLVSINLEIVVDGEKERKLSNRIFEVKENKSIIDFVKNVVGKKVSDSIAYDVSFPEDYFIKEFANKKGTIKIDILKAYHLIIPELNEEFINSLGLEKIKTKEQFLEQFKQDILVQKLNAYKKSHIDTIYDQIIKISEISFYPELLIRKQVNNMIYGYVKELKSRKLTLEEYLKKNNLSIEQFQHDIYLEVKKSFLIENALTEIGEKEKVIVSQEQIDSFYWTLAQRERSSIEEIKNKVDFEKMKSSLLNSLIIDKLIELNSKK